MKKAICIAALILLLASCGKMQEKEEPISTPPPPAPEEQPEEESLPTYTEYKTIHDAAKAGDADAVFYLLSRGADINARDDNAKTLLYYAVEAGNMELARSLLAQGAKASSRYLFTAMENGHPEMVKLLVDARVDVNETGRVLSETPLHRASRLNDIESTRILLEAGADPNLKDYMGNTVLGFSKSDELNALLRSYGAKTSRGFRGEKDE